jgi:hypothetical protein
LRRPLPDFWAAVRPSWREETTELYAAVQGGDPALSAKAVIALGEEVAHQVEVIGEQLGPHLRVLILRVGY